tara:strand:- start:205 stop:1497 length:1293 start_codon:yes stop_codon:yes gene_type:complete
MKRIFLIIFLYFITLGNALAVNLIDALKQALENNTELNAERENIKISRDDLKISKSNYLPTATISGSKSKENTNKLTNQSGGDASINDVDPLTTSLKIEQTLIDFSRNAELKKKKIGLDLAETKLLKKEQDIIFKSIEVFTGLILANEKLLIGERNFNLLDRQVETDKIRLERGQITLADLAQSESSLAGAEALLIEAKNDIVTNRLNYENIIGKVSKINSLEKSSNSIISIPKTLSESIDLSKSKNPDIKIAKLEFNQSQMDIEIAKSDLSPTATLSLERSYTDDLSSTYDEREKDVLKATVSWPFYSGGKKRATLSKNKKLNNLKKLLLENSIKNNNTLVASAWSNLQSSKSFLSSVRSQVKASEIANEGITAEYERGSRTTLDVIQSNTLLLNSQISLANSERNYLLAQYELLKAIGMLNSNHLKIK